MTRKKKQQTEEALERIEESLTNAQEYVASNVNVKGSPQFHLGDWRGKSGHPSWMRNFMIPTLMKRRAKIEKALESIDNKAKHKNLTMRKRHRVR